VEAPIDADDPSLALLDPLLHVPPLSRQLDRRLDRLDAGVHREYHVVSEHLGDLLGVGAEVRRVEGSGGEGAEVCLRDQGLKQSRVAVSLVDSAAKERTEREMRRRSAFWTRIRNESTPNMQSHSRISRQHVDVLIALGIPYSVNR
jgi:hypothetical protein